jgi:sugar (pentulose or hexulose) kinase
MKPVRLLAVDVGTQSARAIVFDEHGNLLAKAQTVFDPTYLAPQPGWAEQDPEVYWRGVAAEALLDDLINSVPPGAMGLTLQPYWTPGVREPGPEAKGAIIGFGDVHTRAHLYRALIEGLVYGLRAGKEQIERRIGRPIRHVCVSGGGSQSDAALQITADVFGLQAQRPEIYETSALGAAMNAAVGLGIHPDYASAAQRMCRIGRVFEPQPEAQKIYDRLYREVYRPMYPRLRPLYERIRAITGYPP